MGKASALTDELIALIVGLFVIIILYVTVVSNYISSNLTGNVQTMATTAVLFIFLAVALGAIYRAIKK